ncbi:PO21 protein, partial [Crypturellus undulatus]|nr:PO21 protein [Crypturellus undulatus]
ILSNRLRRACPINARQRGFIAAPGCSENLKLLQALIKSAKRDHRTLGVVFVNLAKAFDTVNHQHIFRLLGQKGVDKHIIDIISDLYKNCGTSVE